MNTTLLLTIVTGLDIDNILKAIPEEQTELGKFCKMVIEGVEYYKCNPDIFLKTKIQDILLKVFNVSERVSRR